MSCEEEDFEQRYGKERLGAMRDFCMLGRSTCRKLNWALPLQGRCGTKEWDLCKDQPELSN